MKFEKTYFSREGDNGASEAVLDGGQVPGDGYTVANIFKEKRVLS
jgi:hypothetical protein